MKIFCCIFGLSLLSLVSCSCSSLTGPEGQLVWQNSISSGKLISGELPNFLYQGQIIAFGNQFTTAKASIHSFDSESGKLRWTWNDWFIDNGFILTDNIFASNERLVISNDALNYGINLGSGETLWRNRVRGSEGGTLGVNGIGVQYFFGAYFQGGTGQIIQGNLITGVEKILIQFPKATGPRIPTPFIASNQDTMLIVTSVYGEAATNFYNKTYLTLFNVTQNKEIYTLLQREGPSTENNLPMGVPVIQGDRVFTAIGFGVQCNEIATGKLLWRTTTPRPFTEVG